MTDGMARASLAGMHWLSDEGARELHAAAEAAYVAALREGGEAARKWQRLVCPICRTEVGFMRMANRLARDSASS